MKQMTIQDMIDRLEEHKYKLGGDYEVFFFCGGYQDKDKNFREHAPLEVEEIEYREWDNSSLYKLIIK